MTTTSNRDGAPGLVRRVEPECRKGGDGNPISALMKAGAPARFYWNRVLLLYMGLLMLVTTVEGESPPPPIFTAEDV